LEENNIMSRKEFFKKLGRYLLFLILAGIAVIVGSRTVTSSNCGDCAGKGICNGESDCSLFLSDNYGKGKK
jgi:hypothetical protein